MKADSVSTTAESAIPGGKLTPQRDAGDTLHPTWLIYTAMLYISVLLY